jgi:hypothetical protein
MTDTHFFFISVICFNVKTVQRNFHLNIVWLHRHWNGNRYILSLKLFNLRWPPPHRNLLLWPKLSVSLFKMINTQKQVCCWHFSIWRFSCLLRKRLFVCPLLFSFANSSQLKINFPFFDCWNSSTVKPHNTWKQN